MALYTYSFTETPVSAFDFEATVRAHGWAALRPFEWDREDIELGRIHQLDSGPVVRLRMRPAETGAGVTTAVEAEQALSPADQAELRQAVRRMFRLDEDLSPFHRLNDQLDGWRLPLKPGAGRLLRCPRLFEDVVYTLCTTNIAWSGTIRMVDRLTARLGQPLAGQEAVRAFPRPAAIAEAGPDFLKQKTGLGYRSRYVWELAVAVAEGHLDLANLEAPDLPSEELYRRLRQIKGVGAYAAATILMLLGRYEQLAIDSELQAFVSQKYFGGKAASEAQIREIYAPWGQWQYLAYWFDGPPAL